MEKQAENSIGMYFLFLIIGIALVCVAIGDLFIVEFIGSIILDIIFFISGVAISSIMVSKLLISFFDIIQYDNY